MNRGGQTATLLFPLILLYCLASSAGIPQSRKSAQVPKGAQRDEAFSVKVPVNVVIVVATVTDGKGHAVSGLLADDFRVYEDGKQVPIHTFSVETYQPQQTGRGGQSVRQKKDESDADDSFISMPRLFRLVVDDVTMKEIDQLHFLNKAITRFIEEDLSSGDQISISSASGIVDHPFTADRMQMSRDFLDLQSRARPLKPNASECPPLTDLQAHNIANDLDDGLSVAVAMSDMALCTMLPSALELRMQAKAHENEMRFRVRTLLTSLRSTVRSLKHFEGRKSLILCSSGFLSQEFTYEVQDLIDSALRSGVVISVLDPSGLTTNALTAEQRAAGTGLIFSQKSMLQSLSRTAQDGPLLKLAEDTGGSSFVDNNDLHAGLKAVAERESVHYILTYAAPGLGADGSYHKIRLELRRPGLEVNHRKGYYAPKEQMTFEGKAREDILDALRAPGNMKEIPVQISYNFAQADDTHYSLDLMSEINLRQVQFLLEEGRHKNVIQIVMAIYDEADRYLDGYEKTLEFNLSGESYDQILRHGVSSKFGFTLAPGRYKAMTVVRESHKTRMGSAEKIIEVP